MSKVMDRASGWFLGLEPEKCSYSTTPQRIPMPDGITLEADLYTPTLPPNIKLSGLLLVQGCYGRGPLMAGVFARPFAARAYMVLFVSTRGTFGSGGDFEPGMSERADSQSIVKWMRMQSWYPGSFATMGASYLGQSQWALLDDPPEDCTASAILVGPHDYAYHNWGTGSFRLDRISWSDAVANQESTSLVSRAMGRILDKNRLDPVVQALPLSEGVQKHFGGKAPWLHKAIATPDLTDSYWASTRHQIALERVKTPVLLVSGWYDPFTTQTMQQYARLLERKCPVTLVVGPWTHGQAAGTKALADVARFLDEHVAGIRSNDQLADVRIYVTGAELWRDMPAWPPRTQLYDLYLQGNKSLSPSPPPGDGLSLSFVFDPMDPTPSMGGSQLAGGGRVDDTVYASRLDTAVFTSPVLQEDREVLGKPVLQLSHTTDIPFADIFVRLSEVDDTDISHNICDVYKALDPERDTSQPLQVTLQDCAHRFCRGTRIRVIVAGGSFPMYARNLGTEGNRTMTSEARPVRHEIALGLSKLMLPCPVIE